MAEISLLKALFAASVVPECGPASGPDRGWSGFLGALMSELGADGALLQTLEQGRVLRSWGVGAAVSVPPPDGLARMRNDRVYAQLDLPENPDPDRPLRALRCGLGSGKPGHGGFAVLAVQRRGRDFRATDGAHLAGLGPYLGQAITSWRALRHERGRAALERMAGAGLGVTWLRLAPSGRVLGSGVGAGVASGAVSDIQVPGMQVSASGWPEFVQAGAGRAFRQALASVQEAPFQQDGAPSVAGPVDLSRDPPVQMILLRHDFGQGPEPAAILRRAPRAQDLPVDRIAVAFGLNRSEARLAALLCDGFTLETAALRLGWTIQTTRSCSKQVFTRMGVRGQPGVLRRMLTSLVWLG